MLDLNLLQFEMPAVAVFPSYLRPGQQRIYKVWWLVEGIVPRLHQQHIYKVLWPAAAIAL